MQSQFKVFVSRDDRIENQGYGMGLEELMNNPDVEVIFMSDRDTGYITSDDIEGADGLILLKDSVPAETLENQVDLKIISRFGAGFDGVDMQAATEAGVVVTNAPQGISDSVAQATVAMILSCASNIREYDNLVRNQGFDGRLENMGTETFGKTLGTIGLGQIGRRVVELLAPFNLNVLTYDPYLSTERAQSYNVRKTDLEDLLEKSDFVTIHCPLTDETHYMLDLSKFELMKSSAYVINTTRGGIYPDEDLATAIRNKLIAGAAVDVFENEPDVQSNPLLEFEHCIMTPHSAGINIDGLSRCGRIVSDSMLSVMRGKIPKNILNPEVYENVIPEELISPSYRE